MRLLQQNPDGTFAFTETYRKQSKVPQYAALSHTWLADHEEVRYADILDGTAALKSSGYEKIEFCGRQAAADGLDFFWVDTCCINKQDEVELHETLNSMFDWYRGATRCYVYMPDVHVDQVGAADTASDWSWETAFRSSKWFTRGWTLQELLAPRFVTFYSAEGKRLGYKHSLQQWIHEITGIPIEALQGRALSGFAVDERMSWARTRRTTLEEDQAYCLLGIFGIFMPVIYGEKEHAMLRLKEEIAKKYPEVGQIDHLLDTLPVAYSAAFDSRENEHEDLCLPGTRVALLRDIERWVEGSDDKCIYWLKGVAGTGKSTIARTIATTYANQKLLGGSFFFSRGGGDAGNADKLVTTLAHHLACKIEYITQYVCEVIMKNREIAHRALREQWRELIMKPLSQLHSGTAHATVVMIIDALDECGNEKDVGIILSLFQQAKSLKNVKLRIFITSRAELQVRDGFLMHIPKAERHDLVLQDISPTQIDEDLTVFFRERFGTVKIRHRIKEEWPSEREISRLVERSSGLFMWAATAYCYVLTGRFVRKRLSKLIDGERLRGTPEQRLDQIYITVLKDAFQRYEEEEEEDERFYMQDILKDLLGNIASLLWPLSADSMAALLGIDASMVTEALEDLHAIISVPEDSGRPLRILHPSFRDFLLDRSRCSDLDLWIDGEQAHKRLAGSCVSYMAKHLKRNICGLRDPGVFIENIPAEVIADCVPPALRYACLYWAEHCRQGSLHLKDNDDFHRLMQHHFLHWLEVMSLSGRVSQMASIMRWYQSVLSPANNSEQVPLIKDSRHFMFTFQSTIERTPLQIYCAAIVYTPLFNILRERFWGQIHPRLRSVKIVESIRPEKKDEYNYVNDLSFTPDSRRVASGSLDGWVRIWDVASKTPLCRMGPQSDKISSVAISADGTMLASGSDNSTAIIHDLRTRKPHHKLTGHTRWVNVVQFSPDDRLLATGSMDETLRLWNTETGAQTQVLDSIGTGVNDICFSPDNSMIALGTVDAVIRLWDFRKGEMLAILDGHSGPVNSVAFSPDSKRIVSGSDDTSIKIWAEPARREVMTISRHTKPVYAVTYSPDASVIASGSTDGTVRVFDAHNGALLHTLEGHSSGINAVKYSPDGRLLASGSFDDEVRLWNAGDGVSRGKLVDFSDATGKVQGADESLESSLITDQAFTGRAQIVTRIIFSPDGQSVATGSSDHVVKLWSKDGSHLSVLEGHTDAITGLAFSPDSRKIVSVSRDCTAKLWATTTGQLLHTLEAHSGPVCLVRFSADGCTVATCSADNSVILWSAADGVMWRRLESHSAEVCDVAFSLDGKILATSSADTTICLWEVFSARQPLVRLAGHTKTVNCVRFSPQDDLVASCSSDRTVKIWDETGNILHSFEGHELPVTSVAFSPDTRRVVSCSEDMTIRIWCLETGKVLDIMHVGAAVRNIAFSPCGRRIDTERGALSANATANSSVTISRHPAWPLFTSEEWLRHNPDSALWLPDEYRATDVATWRETTVLGHASGAIPFIGL